MIVFCAGGYCGMLPKTGSLVAGIYMILMTNMYIIFETAHLNRAKKHQHTGDNPIIYCYYSAVLLACLTYPICFLLIYSAWNRNTNGMIAYIVWIILYDIGNVTILIMTFLTGRNIQFSVHPLEWFGLACRLPVDCFWLSYIVIYTLMIFESRSKGRLSLKVRRLSKHVQEPPKYRLGMCRKIQ
ncbi:transmembrane protein 217 [Paroedura picta]|uniref:transmembrane protein 217 n=1 Tax=Paroedura picta TaxID=143630 RepID=UPI004056B20E